PDVFRDRLPAPAFREDEVDDCPLDRFLRIRQEIDIVLWTALPGFHEDRAAGPRNEPAEVLMPLPLFLFVRDIHFLRVSLTDTDSPPCEGGLCGLQNPFKPPVDHLPGFG